MAKPLRAILVASLAVLAATGSQGESRQGDVAGPAATMPQPDMPLSVMTYNVMGLPWPVALGREQALGRIADRLAALRRAGRQPHIVLLQEAFSPQAEQLARRAGYAHVAIGPDRGLRTVIAAGADDRTYLQAARWDRGETAPKQLNSGLLILSDYPITGIDRMAYPDFACAGFDCLANKGVLIAHLAVPSIDRPVSVVNTHLNARKAAGVAIARSQRAFDRQAGILADFVRRHVPAGQSMILGGDLNIGGDRHRIRAFFRRWAETGMDFVAAHLGGARRALVDRVLTDVGNHADLEQASARGKDWLFARDDRGRPMRAIHAAVPFGTEVEGAPLSDHFGYMIAYAPDGGKVQLVSREAVASWR
ncbi:endonuclease/exonuclease/phosphatase family protein [Sphingobium scionense]|uniref:Endonuclease/exonuclease/phosphatase family metal-dependent hydrolase n=1 Tax=Sphingobium scionense TaxID=1404341 RepID=A0A7W6LQY4_9SPHN|nr:endonuclease/exonuclease/phosphatase family protein [Sphingobium scionense]MBB4148880.1 endonuclease/exonuclease/phosphatase family metal-dependent hydrolase [Sphingobium scionense]